MYCSKLIGVYSECIHQRAIVMRASLDSSAPKVCSKKKNTKEKAHNTVYRNCSIKSGYYFAK